MQITCFRFRRPVISFLFPARGMMRYTDYTDQRTQMLKGHIYTWRVTRTKAERCAFRTTKALEINGYGIPKPCPESFYSGTLTCRYQVEIDRDVKGYKRRANIFARAGPSGGNERRYYIYQYQERPIGASNAFLFTTPIYPNGGNGANLDAERGQ